MGSSREAAGPEHLVGLVADVLAVVVGPDELVVNGAAPGHRLRAPGLSILVTDFDLCANTWWATLHIHGNGRTKSPRITLPMIAFVLRHLVVAQ